MKKASKRPGRVIVTDDDEVKNDSAKEGFEITKGPLRHIATEGAPAFESKVSTSDEGAKHHSLADLSLGQRAIRDGFYQLDPLSAHRFTAAVKRARGKKHEGVDYDPNNRTRIGLRGKVYELGPTAQEIVSLLFVALPNSVSIEDLAKKLKRSEGHRWNIRGYFRKKKKVNSKSEYFYSEVIITHGNGLVTLKI